MDRLTRQIMPDFHGYERTVCTFCPRTGVKACTLTEISCFALQVYNRLAAYEDTGLTPEEIIVQQSELTRLRAELDAANKRADAAVWDMKSIADKINGCEDFLSGGKDKVKDLQLGRCSVCQRACESGDGCHFEWHGTEAQP